MDVRVGLWRKLSAEKLMLEKTLESPLDCKEIQPVHSKGDQPWVFFRRNDAKAETPVLWPPHAKSWLIGKDWCWEVLGARGEGDDRGWDGWMASPTRWTWVLLNSGSWWWTRRPGVLQFMGSQGVKHNWETELYWTERKLWLQICSCLQDYPALWLNTIPSWVMYFTFICQLGRVHPLHFSFNREQNIFHCSKQQKLEKQASPKKWIHCCLWISFKM